MREADEAAAVLFGNGDSHLGRGGIDARVPAEFDPFVFVQFEVMAARVEIPAPPQVHAPSRTRIDGGYIA